MTIRSWVRLVGDVWLVGTHPQWPTSASADPLVIEMEGSRYPGASIRDHFDGELEAWNESPALEPAAGPFVLPVAPDRLHKENVSGGQPYGIVLPDACADALFAGEATMPFVSYLNWGLPQRRVPLADRLCSPVAREASPRSRPPTPVSA